LNALGTHLLLDLEDCSPALLDDIEHVRQALISAASEAGATIVGEIFHKFQPLGVTGILAIAESHMGVHTWPEYGFAAVDIFTCGEDFSPHKAAVLLIDRLECANPTLREVKRGFIQRRVASPVEVPR
jgi:S-adenosylmethionine decarboxylase